MIIKKRVFFLKFGNSKTDNTQNTLLFIEAYLERTEVICRIYKNTEFIFIILNWGTKVPQTPPCKIDLLNVINVMHEKVHH